MTVEQESINDEIQEIYKSLDHKSNFVKDLASHLGLGRKTIHNHWFHNTKQVSNIHLNETLRFIKQHKKQTQR